MSKQGRNSTSVKWTRYLLSDIEGREYCPIDPSWTLQPVLPARFFRKIKIESTGCWLWTGAYGFHPRYPEHRYGEITVWDRRTRTKTRTTAHKFAYVYTHGEVPPGCDIDHKCENKLCVNPSHLQALPHSENMFLIARRKAGRA